MYRGGAARVGTRRVVYRGTTQRAPSTDTLVLPGPNPLLARGSAPTLGTPGPCRTLRTPRAPRTQYTPPEANKGEIRVYILKLVHKPECRLKVVMRPAIVPISKSPRNVTTLNFQDFLKG